MKKIKLVVVDDDKSFLFLIQQTLKNEINLDVCTLCSSKKDAVTAARTYSLDLVLMDLNLESTWMDGVEAARTIRLETDARIIILTSYDQPEVILEACRQAFASAYVLKNQFSMLVPTIQTTFSGITPQSLFIYNAILETLSPAERAVFQQMLGKDISLRSKSKTIANQQSSILHKLGLSSKSELCHVFSSYLMPISDGKEHF